MFKEYDIIKGAKAFTKTEGRNNNIIDNRGFAIKQVIKHRDYGPPQKTLRKLMTDLDYDFSSMDQRNFSSHNRKTMFTNTIYNGSSAFTSNKQMIRKNRNSKTSINTRRPATQAKRASLDVTKLSQINNFNSCHNPKNNVVNNLSLNTSEILNQTRRKLINVEVGLPIENASQGRSAQKSFHKCMLKLFNKFIDKMSTKTPEEICKLNNDITKILEDLK